MRYGVVVEELAVEVMAQLPDDQARQEVMALVEVARMNPQAWPDVRDPGSVEEIREAFGRRCWIPARSWPHSRTPGAPFTTRSTLTSRPEPATCGCPSPTCRPR
ncbi:hypothetical protein [Streptomyces sp. NPDC088847]|uniref:hypothetical protein n=1 Tax=Streptomyces sp. NPDC088847 TaxID=3365909 RepID=UPI0037F98EF6